MRNHTVKGPDRSRSFGNNIASEPAFQQVPPHKDDRFSPISLPSQRGNPVSPQRVVRSKLNKKTSATVLTMTDQQRDLIEETLAEIAYEALGPHGAGISAAKKVVAGILTPGQCQHLKDLSTPGIGGRLIVVENVPFDAAVKNGPVDPESPDRAKKSALSENVMLGFVGNVGAPYGIVQEGRGLASNVTPKRDRVQTFTGLGTVELALHIESAFGRTLPGDRAPDGLALIGVSRELGESPTTPVADARLALRRIGPKKEKTLREGRFLTRRPVRWRASGKAEQALSPVIVGSSAMPSVILAAYGDMIEACDHEARDALDAFIEALNEVAIDLCIEPGRLAMLDNHILLHGRREFTAAFTPEGAPFRWLQRVFWTSSLERLTPWKRMGDHLFDVTGAD